MKNATARVNWENLRDIVRKLYVETEQLRAELVQARAELARELQAAQDWLSPADAEELRRQLTAMKENRNFWFNRCHDTESERDYWLKKHDELELKYGMEGVIERIATLDETEAALADCGSRGIYTDFDGPADAIMQMAARIEKLEDETMIEVEITGVEMVRALQAERQSRREAERVYKATSVMARNRGERLEQAEQRAERAKAELANGHAVLTEADIPRDKFGGKRLIASRTMDLKQRAERAEALSADRQALAALVTPELAVLLENMASCCREYADVREPADRLHPSRGYVMSYRRDAKNARALAAEIRRILDDSKT